MSLAKSNCWTCNLAHALLLMVVKILLRSLLRVQILLSHLHDNVRGVRNHWECLGGNLWPLKICSSSCVYKALPWWLNFLQNSINLAFIFINKTVQPFACRNRVTGVFQASTAEKYPLFCGLCSHVQQWQVFQKKLLEFCSFSTIISFKWEFQGLSKC